MAKSTACGLHSLTCRVANCVRYIQVHVMGQDISFSDQREWRNDMYENMVADAFCEATVANLLNEISTVF